MRWLVHPLLRIKDHQSSPPYLIFSVSSGCMKKIDPEYFLLSSHPEYFLLSSHHRSDLVRAHTS